jgi:hypothetical protein
MQHGGGCGRRGGRGPLRRSVCGDRLAFDTKEKTVKMRMGCAAAMIYPGVAVAAARDATFCGFYVREGTCFRGCL